MERKEPTLSSGISASNASEHEDPSIRRPAADHSEPRQSRPIQVPPASNTSSLPAIALVIALLGVGGAAFLGVKLTEAQAALLNADGRITQLENQLNVASTESTASLGSLQVNIRTVDSDVKSLRENTRKATAENTEKLSGLGKSLDAIKAELGNVKNDASSIKQDVLANKLTFDELPPRVDAVEKSLAEQGKRVQDVAKSISTLQNQVKTVEGITARVTSAEEAIDAIDDNRKIINRDLVQIKQQLGIKN